MNFRLAFTAALIALTAVPAAAQWGHDDRIRVRVHERIDRVVSRAIDRAERAAWRVHDRVLHRLHRVERVANMSRLQRLERLDRIARIERVQRVAPFAYLGPLGFAGSDASQDRANEDPCRDRGWDDNNSRHCEVREESIAAGALTVDASPNGGIRVEGWDQNTIRVQAIVQANARDAARAREIAQGVQLVAGNGRVSAQGPSSLGRREGWSVSFRINVPHKNDLNLSTHNGGISIAAVAGDIRFVTHNGGVTLRELAGTVRGETRNGGVTVTLDGKQWNGQGLDVETTNGGVTLNIPDGYNAQLETRTRNGGLHVDYPITLQGELSPQRGINTTLGSGGPLVRVLTMNGGLRINRR